MALSPTVRTLPIRRNRTQRRRDAKRGHLADFHDQRGPGRQAAGNRWSGNRVRCKHPHRLPAPTACAQEERRPRLLPAQTAKALRPKTAPGSAITTLSRNQIAVSECGPVGALGESRETFFHFSQASSRWSTCPCTCPRSDNTHRPVFELNCRPDRRSRPWCLDDSVGVQLVRDRAWLR